MSVCVGGGGGVERVWENWEEHTKRKQNIVKEKIRSFSFYMPSERRFSVLLIIKMLLYQ